MKVPVIIPARKGSKGIKDKNIMNFCGKPLIAWSIEQAMAAECVSSVYVSTDGSNIAAVAEQYGAKIIQRPDELSTDISSSEDALLHALPIMEHNGNFDSVIFLQATSPIRQKGDIDAAMKTFLDGNYDSLFSMACMDDYTLWSGKEGGELRSISFDWKNRGRRQDREPVYLENGSIYIFKKELLRTTRNRMGGKIGMYRMPLWTSFEIDSNEDVGICMHYMQKLQECEK